MLHYMHFGRLHYWMFSITVAIILFHACAVFGLSSALGPQRDQVTVRRSTSTDSYLPPSNPFEVAPTTNVTRYYNFTITRGIINLDGYDKSALLVNNQYPGPEIEANWGDEISVQVTNLITGPEEGTSLHWHGFSQRYTPWYDGVPSVQQCPIAPNQTLTYTFQADMYGTSWWHSHYSAQYAAGIMGPMIVNGPQIASYDEDLGPLFLTDWYRADYNNIIEELMAIPSVNKPPSDNNLMFGESTNSCNMAGNKTICATYIFQTGKTYRLRLINNGAEGMQRFTIDKHQLTVIANDFVPVTPYQTNIVSLAVGQRTDVLIKADLPSNSSVFIRSDISATCSIHGANPHALGLIYYSQANTTALPTSSATPYNDTLCKNDPLSTTIPLDAFPANPSPATTLSLEITTGMNSSGNLLWLINNHTFRANYDHPVYLHANHGNLSFAPDSQVINLGTSPSVRLVLHNYSPGSHPMHLHGHNFQVLADGIGNWTASDLTRISNPQRRDTHILQGASPMDPMGSPGYLVLQFEADNAGVWGFHCHVAWHSGVGFYVNLLERPDLIAEQEVPKDVGQTCKTWGTYAHANVVDQIDSGL
ncbi:MAG: hypothetical protein M1827_007091 [Pycnora praestabilis]|nr:MAG: hypothetical protein M1827_007091 [Pycnora praestabilis]